VVSNVNKKVVPAHCIHGAYTPLPPASTAKGATGFQAIVVDVLMPVRGAVDDKAAGKGASNTGYGLGNGTEPYRPAAQGPFEFALVPVLLSAVDQLATVRLKANGAADTAARTALGLQLTQALKRLRDKATDSTEAQSAWNIDGVPVLHPLEQMRVEGDSVKALVQRLISTHEKVVTHKLHTHPQRQVACSVIAHQQAIDGYVKWLEQRLRDLSQDAGLRTTMHGMKRVLRTLGLADHRDVITAKGRVACELSTCDELVGTELIFSSAFNELTPAQICALCSCMVFDEPHDDEKPNLCEELASAHRRLVEVAKAVAKVVSECRLPVDVEKFASTFNPFMMNAVSSWCDGAKFADICGLTDVFEGTIIRVMRRLEELLRQMAAAAAAVGNDELHSRFNDCIKLLKRDIVFAASLYL